MSKVLLALDTDQIKRYVFATGKLKEIRGASQILVDLNEMMKRIEGEIIYANAGSGLFVVEANSASDTITRFQNIYAERTSGAASVTGAFVDLPPNIDSIQPYWKRLSRKLELAKAQKAGPQTILTFPLLRHCDSCGEYSASIEYDEGLICPVCLAKHKRIDEVNKESRKNNIPFPETFEDISDHSRPQGYFALLYADGDGFGTEIEKRCRTLAEIGVFATAVEAALKKSVEAATNHISKDAFSVLLQGGDDLIVALPAQHALRAAHEIAVTFHKEIQETLKMPLTISAAVVWAHDKFPFARFRRLTESALKFAKTEGVKRGERGLINFLVVSNANHLDFGTFYKKNLALDKNGLKIIRTLRPYTPEALDRLMEARRSDKVAQAPKSKIQQLRQAVFRQSFQQASLDAMMTLSHWRDETQKKYFMQLPIQLMPKAQSFIFPWVRKDGEYRTPFADLAEIYDFTAGESDAAENESH